MDLQQFLHTAIVQIVAGVADAREAVREYGASAGSDSVYGYVKDNKILTDGTGRQVTLVEFDVALGQADSAEARAGIGVFLGSVGLGSQGSSRGEASSLSRVRFTVPVVLPGEGKRE